MQTVISIFMAIIFYLSTVFTGIPALIEQIKKPDQDYDWMVTKAEIVTYDNYQEIYDEYTTQTPKYPDKTAEYQKLLDDNLAIASNWRTDPINGQIEFYYSVRDHGVWDYKRADRHPEWSGESGCFSAYNVDMDCEILGNLNFGFTGAAVGFTPTVIYTGGGIVAVKNGSSSWEDYYYYFDSEHDHQWIAFGILLYSLVDPNYESDVAAIDIALSIVDPRIVSSAYLAYVNMQDTNAEKAKAIEHLEDIDQQVEEIVKDDYQSISNAIES